MAEGSPVISSDDRTRSWLILALGLVVTIGLVVAVVALWPDGDDSTPVASESDGDGDGTTKPPKVEDAATTTVPGATGEPSATTAPPTTEPGPVDLYLAADLAAALADLVAAAGGATEAIEVAVYGEYAFLAYRDPANPANLDRRIWRDGEAGPAEPNPIDDRVDEDTAPDLFALAEIDPAAVERSVGATPQHFSMPVDISHVIIDRFLPFDERVLIRVYATPSDGRSGGGYVSFTTAGELVNVVS